MHGWLQGVYSVSTPEQRFWLGGVCTDWTVKDRADCWGEFKHTTEHEREWISEDMNFNNIFKAMQTLFEMSTTEGWTSVMYNGMDSTSTTTSMRQVLISYLIGYVRFSEPLNLNNLNPKACALNHLQESV